jgi:hypothetical protein
VGVFVSFLIVLAMIAVVRAVFPDTLYDGFTNMSCYGVKCNEGEFCQEGVCRAINPPYTNNYYNKGVEGFSTLSGPFQNFLVDIFLTYLLIPTLILVAIWLGVSYFVNTPARVSGNVRV